MGKYDQTKYLKKTKARTSHQCDLCNSTIKAKEYYYAETQKDKFLHSLHAKRFCSECYEKFGDQLLSIKRKRKQSGSKMALQKDPLEVFHRILEEHDAVFRGLNSGSKKVRK